MLSQYQPHQIFTGAILVVMFLSLIGCVLGLFWFGIMQAKEHIRSSQHREFLRAKTRMEMTGFNKQDGNLSLTSK